MSMALISQIGVGKPPLISRTNYPESFNVYFTRLIKGFQSLPSIVHRRLCPFARPGSVTVIHVGAGFGQFPDRLSCHDQCPLASSDSCSSQSSLDSPRHPSTVHDIESISVRPCTLYCSLTPMIRSLLSC